MSVKIRLSRGGAKKRPYYYIVVAEASAPRDGRYIEQVGTHNPLLPKDHADRVKLNIERCKHWLGVGAQPTDRVSVVRQRLRVHSSHRRTVLGSLPKLARPVGEVDRDVRQPE